MAGMSVHCSWRDVMREAADRLRAAGVEGATRDVRLLLAHALGIEPIDVIVREMDAVDPLGLTAFEAVVKRREAGEPVARIRGWREFYGRRFIVTPDVLDPRPETELLVSEGLARLPNGGRVLDLGVGSGCILLSVLAERADARGVGLDISAAAIDVARRNADALGVAGRAVLAEGGWHAPAGEGGFDVVLSNPPYIGAAELPGLGREVINHDPPMALSPGADGLSPYRAILASATHWARPGGWFGFEFGLGQGDLVADLMRSSGLEEVSLHPDLAGITRAAFGRRPSQAP
jgi:release factor glutamine methyltransferase